MSYKTRRTLAASLA